MPGFLVLVLATWAAAAAPLPARPDRYVTDRTGRLDATRLAALNETLAAFERDTSTQVVVYVDARLPAGATLDEVAAEAMRQWGVGQQGKDNGVLFLAFLDDRVMRIEVGYGLEGALPDARAARIISEVVTPWFRQGDFTRGVEAAANEVVKAARGEPFQGTGRTAAESPGAGLLDTIRVEWVAVGLVALIPLGLVLVTLRRSWRAASKASRPLARTAGRLGVLFWIAWFVGAPFAVWQRTPFLLWGLLALFQAAVATSGLGAFLQKKGLARVRSLVGHVAVLVAASTLPALLRALVVGGTDATTPLLITGGALFLAMVTSADGLGATGGGGYSYSSSGSSWSSSSSSGSSSSSSSFSGGGGSSGGGGASGSW